MSNDIPNAATLLEFANLQVAAEALYVLDKDKIKDIPLGSTNHIKAEIKPELLQFGNNRTSKFTATQAEEFAQKWEIVSHIANTGTGFSGTPSRQLKILRDWCRT